MNKYILFTNEFGYSLYIADIELCGTEISDIKAHSLEFSLPDDNPDIKLGYWKALTGYKDLQIEYLTSP